MTSTGIARSVAPALIGRAVKERTQVIAAASFYMLLIGAVLGLLWPPLRDVFRGLPQSMVALVKAISGGTDLSTPTGWANAELLSLLAPAAVIVAGVASAAASSAGEEENRTLGMTLSAPVSRAAFLASAMVAMATGVLIVSVCVALGLELGSVIGGLGFSVAGVTGVAAHAFVFGILFGAIGFLVGSATGSKRAATLVPTVVAVAAFAVNTFFPLSKALEPGQKYSPWYYFLSSNPLVHGADGWHVLLLAGIAVVLGVAAVIVFQRRDLRG